MVSRAFALAVVALCGAGFVAGCASPVPNADGSLQYGDTRQFRLPSGMGLNVTREGGQARVLYPLEYPLTDAEAAHFIQTATGCRPAGLVQSFSTQYNRAMNRTYLLACG